LLKLGEYGWKTFVFPFDFKGANKLAAAWRAHEFQMAKRLFSLLKAEAAIVKKGAVGPAQALPVPGKGATRLPLPP